MDQDNMPGSGVDRRGFLKLSVWGGAALAVGAGASHAYRLQLGPGPGQRLQTPSR